MPREKTVKPAVESLPLSNFLTVEVSEKKKTELDKILICKPDIVDPQICIPSSPPICVPMCRPRCIPMCFPLCRPACRPWLCRPIFDPICFPVRYEEPEYVCTPGMVTTPIPPEELYELYGEMKEMFTALEKVKAEIAEIKKKISK